MATNNLTDLTILDLTRLITAQDDRWSRILTLSQSTRNPAAAAGFDFFRKTWRPVLDSYFSGVASRFNGAARVPSRVVAWVINAMSSAVYPAARRVGFPEQSFLLPELTLEQQGHPATVGAEPPPRPPRETASASRVAIAALAVSALGFAYYTHDVHRLHQRSLRAA